MMEFDFLNVSEKESGDLAKEQSMGGCDDSAFSVGSVLLPLLDNASLQQSMTFKTMQEQKPKNFLFNPISATAFRHISSVGAFESNQKVHVVDTSQFAIHAYQNQEMDIYSSSTPHVNDMRFSSALHPSILNTINSAFSKFHGSSSGHNPTGAVNHQPSGSEVLKNTFVGVSEVEDTFPRKILMTATTSAQLTIFYAGSVNVYDDVPCDKAQNVLRMACEGCKAAANAVDSSAEAPALPFSEGPVADHLGVAQTPKMVGSHVVSLGISSTLSLASHIGNQSYLPVPADGKVGVQTMETSSQADPSKTMKTSMEAVTADIILPIAVPQSRKASLARFLEKRKERASGSMPYSCDKKTLD